MLIRHGRNAHANLIEFGITEHRLQRAGAAAAPAPNANAAGINKFPLPDIFLKRQLGPAVPNTPDRGK